MNAIRTEIIPHAVGRSCRYSRHYRQDRSGFSNLKRRRGCETCRVSASQPSTGEASFTVGGEQNGGVWVGDFKSANLAGQTLAAIPFQGMMQDKVLSGRHFAVVLVSIP